MLSLQAHLLTGCYSRLFLVQRASGGCRLVFHLLALSQCYCYTLQDGDSGFDPRTIRKGDVMFLDRPGGLVLPDTHSPRLDRTSRLPCRTEFSRSRSLTFRFSLLPKSSPSVRVDSQARDLSSSVSQQLANHCMFSPSSVITLGVLSQSLQRPWDNDH